MAKSWSDNAPAPTVLKEHAHLKDPFSYRLKKNLLGSPLNRHSLSHQRLKKRFALGILSSDCISSSAYGSEEILLVLIPAFGFAAFSNLIPMTFIILGILVLLTLSYNNVIAKYTSSGGAYIVARDNLGQFWSIVAAVALILDYVVTVSVQTAAGIVAITSFFPSLAPYNVEMCVAFIFLLTYGNLRGVKEAGKAFALPTYLFVVSMFTVFLVGIYKEITHHLHHLATNQPGMMSYGHNTKLLSVASIFILLRAFANGGSSLTGLEAISNGVSLFEPEEGHNARITMNVMAGLLGTLVFGVSWFAHSLHATPYDSGTPSVISEIAKAIMGNGTAGQIWYAFVQFATALILLAGANTVYNALPILGANIALDGFLPRQLSKRGHKLVFSNGIIICSGLAILLIVFANGSVNALVALYALGVFTAFTITGYGMFINLKNAKEKMWRLKSGISLAAAILSFVVVFVFATVKFMEGAWIICIAGPTLVTLMYRFSKRYHQEQDALALSVNDERAISISRHDVTVLVDSVDLATVGTIRYARSLKPRNLTALHFVIDDRRAEFIKKAWADNAALADIALELIDCPDRRLPNAAVDYAIRATAAADTELTLLLPRRSYSNFMGRLMHDQTAEAIAAPMSQLSRVVATIVPFDVERMIHGDSAFEHPELVAAALSDHAAKAEVPTPVRSVRTIHDPVQTSEVSHYSEDLIHIGECTWRRRAHVRGRVSAIRTAPSGSTPKIDVEIWDETGGITLQFLGRREIAGVEVGKTICAEGMVGEQNGALTILNPSYEIVL